MIEKRVIAFLGRAGSGKTTAGNYVVEKYGATRVSFAGPLKELAKLLFDFTDEQVYGSQESKETVDPRYGFTPRKAMQNLGNGAREIIGKTVWTDACFNTIRKTDSNLFVIDDCRYVNEARLIQGLSVFSDNVYIPSVIKLVCPDSVSNDAGTHPSEAEVDMVPPEFIDFTIESARSPGSVDLLSKIDACLDRLDIRAK